MLVQQTNASINFNLGLLRRQPLNCLKRCTLNYSIQLSKTIYQQEHSNHLGISEAAWLCRISSFCSNKNSASFHFILQGKCKTLSEVLSIQSFARNRSLNRFLLFSLRVVKSPYLCSIFKTNF